jgi:hypothetical protein
VLRSLLEERTAQRWRLQSRGKSGISGIATSPMPVSRFYMRPATVRGFVFLGLAAQRKNRQRLEAGRVRQAQSGTLTFQRLPRDPFPVNPRLLFSLSHLRD